MGNFAPDWLAERPSDERRDAVLEKFYTILYAKFLGAFPDEKTQKFAVLLEQSKTRMMTIELLEAEFPFVAVYVHNIEQMRNKYIIDACQETSAQLNPTLVAEVLNEMDGYREDLGYSEREIIASALVHEHFNGALAKSMEDYGDTDNGDCTDNCVVVDMLLPEPRQLNEEEAEGIRSAKSIVTENFRKLYADILAGSYTEPFVDSLDDPDFAQDSDSID